MIFVQTAITEIQQQHFVSNALRIVQHAIILILIVHHVLIKHFFIILVVYYHAQTQHMET